MLDCLIVGGGPAGLTAGLYLSRFLRNVRIVDAGASRALLIPSSHNYPGFKGIAGVDLLQRLREQAIEYGVNLTCAEVTDLAFEGDHFWVDYGETQKTAAKTIIIATGLVDRAPQMLSAELGRDGDVIRYCPICDGYEAIDKRIGVLGDFEPAGKKALFLRTYSRHVVLLARGSWPSDGALVAQLKAADIDILPEPYLLKIGGTGLLTAHTNQQIVELDVLYPALGCEVGSRLAQQLGAECDRDGALLVDSHQRTRIPGLYAIGDVVTDLHQLSVATGHAAVAASAIHNSLPANPR